MLSAYTQARIYAYVRIYYECSLIKKQRANTHTKSRESGKERKNIARIKTKTEAKVRPSFDVRFLLVI